MSPVLKPVSILPTACVVRSLGKSLVGKDVLKKKQML